MGPTRTAAAFWASGASCLPDSGADCPMARRSMRKGLSGTAGSAAAAWFGLRRMEGPIQSPKPPTHTPTTCAFGGPDYRTLYVTSARIGTAAGDRLAGGVFALRTEVPGLPSF